MKRNEDLIAMLRKIALLTPEDANFGFQLAGFTQFTCNEKTLGQMLDTVILDTSYGIIAIDERLVTEDFEQKMQEIQESWNGVMVILPSPASKRPPGPNYAERLLRRAIGYQVKMVQ